MLLTEWHIHYGLAVLRIFCHCVICCSRQLQKPISYWQFGPLSSKTWWGSLAADRMVVQETLHFSCKDGLVLCRYPVKAVVSWCNLSLPAPDEIIPPPPCPSLGLRSVGFAKHIRVHLRPLNSPLRSGTCSDPLVQVTFPVLSGFVSLVTVPSHGG